LELGDVEGAKQVQQRFMDAGGDVATLAGAGAAGEVVLEETGTEIAMSPITAVGGALTVKLLKRGGGWALKKTVQIGKKTVDVTIDRSRIVSRRLRDRLDGRLRAEAAESAAPKGAGKYLADNWHQGTFPNRMQSVRYHLAKHGKGRTAQQYTQDAMEFFQKNKHLGQKVTLKDGTAGIKIQTKIKIPGQKTQRIGGYWTQDGKLVTFWD